MPQDLYDSKQFCDVTLRVEGQEFRAHKAVLACSRSFLGAMMASGMREESQDTIVLKDIGAREVCGLFTRICGQDHISGMVFGSVCEDTPEKRIFMFGTCSCRIAQSFAPHNHRLINRPERLDTTPLFY